MKGEVRFDGVGCVPVAIGVEKGNCAEEHSSVFIVLCVANL